MGRFRSFEQSYVPRTLYLLPGDKYKHRFNTTAYPSLTRPALNQYVSMYFGCIGNRLPVHGSDVSATLRQQGACRQNRTAR